MNDTDSNVRLISQYSLRIGFSLLTSPIEVLRNFFNNHQVRKEIDQYKSVFGKNFKSKEALILSGKQENDHAITQITMYQSKKELKMLKDMCMKRGIDIYIEQRPKHMEDIFDRYKNKMILTEKEKDYLNAFTIEVNGQKELVKDGSIIQFKVKDLDLMDITTKDLEYELNTIEKRKNRASARRKQNSEKSHEHSRAKEFHIIDK